jgi:hypothetical protein
MCGHSSDRIARIAQSGVKCVRSFSTEEHANSQIEVRHAAEFPKSVFYETQLLVTPVGWALRKPHSQKRFEQPDPIKTNQAKRDGTRLSTVSEHILMRHLQSGHSARSKANL